MEDVDKNVGSYIKQIRKSKKMSIVKLSELSGVSNPYISQIENNKFKPSLDIVRKLATALETDFYELAWRAGLYTDEEIEQAREQRSFFEKMTPEEEEAYIHAQARYSETEEWRRLEYPDVKEFLNGNQVFFDKKRLNKEQRQLALKVLNALFEDLDQNYPSKEEIEKQVNHLKEAQVNFSKKD